MNKGTLKFMLNDYLNFKSAFIGHTFVVEVISYKLVKKIILWCGCFWLLDLDLATA
jgi:hypothetical protein